MSDGFTGAKRAITAQVAEFLGRNNVTPADMACSVFGLAGADFEWQKEELRNIITTLGFEDFVVDNDGYLGLKAGSPDGTGVCSINGTGTVSVGINYKGERVQVGGIGGISSDNAGGNFLGNSVAAAVYDACFRCGDATILKDMVFDTFKIVKKEDYPEIIIKAVRLSENILKLNTMLKEAEKKGDKAAIKILEQMGKTLGLTVAGCLGELKFTAGTANIVLAGSVWVKGAYPSMLESFKKNLAKNIAPKLKLNYKILNHEPAIGAVIWALEGAGTITENIRSKLLSSQNGL